MTESASPELLEALAENRAEFAAASAEISERAERQEREIIEAAEQRRQESLERCKELDEQAAANKEAREDPNSKNEWLQRRDDGGGRTMDFGPAGDELEEAPVDPAPAQPTAPTPQPPVAEPPQQSTQPVRPPARPRTDEDDDEDFANRDWFV
ncbi:hypothetical protein FB384_001010 [Prauserella sediminis]|uniref:Uncharacterized protein n=1 Tax=Prauserella sediminis TaxID=577680 RepID=A0A839XQ92_9PSEU|nr:hypothetical protein [Prauserella sediminis]MBB3662106.1 hypothetical protein [Prauserella sediminis]